MRGLFAIVAAGLAAVAAMSAGGTARAQYTDGVIRIGVLNDMSGLYADLGGQGSVFAARQAVEDFGAAQKGMKVEIVSADHQNKPDIGAGIARSWIDRDKVDVIVDIPKFSAALGGHYPTMVQAGVYAAVLHYLKAVEALKSDADGKAVVDKMKELPTDDPLFGKGLIRADGRKIHDMYLFEVKKPAESKHPWDYYKLRATIPAAEAFRPLKDGGCVLVGADA